MSSAGNRTAGSGLTFIEVLVALAIVALISAVTAPAISVALERARFSAAARALATGLKTARNKALAEHREVAFVLDVERHLYTAAGRQTILTAPRDATLTLVTAQATRLDDDTGAILFFPDGSATGGTITLAHGDRAAVIAVDWLTGHVEITE